MAVVFHRAMWTKITSHDFELKVLTNDSLIIGLLHNFAYATQYIAKLSSFSNPKQYHSTNKQPPLI